MTNTRGYTDDGQQLSPRVPGKGDNALWVQKFFKNSNKNQPASCYHHTLTNLYKISDKAFPPCGGSGLCIHGRV